MAVATPDPVRSLRDLPLLLSTQQRELDQLAQRLADPKALVQELVQRGWLTPFQANCVLAGQASSLLMGPYVILDRLGQGGMGQVFRARHSSLDRVVALKVLRAEMVADSEAVSRFYREITVAGHLPEHPNLIRAYDAGPFGATHFLAMEFVAGTDLDRLVKQSGPLPVEQACEYIRQAALGLQHAHQHGLVHRDIKPSNLFVASEKATVVSGEGLVAREKTKSRESSPVTRHSPATVKILDLGLARLHTVKHNGTGQPAFMTTDGAVTLGTVDYQAPEQALDFHRADIRADIYSLGCTFYYLLTGKPPFGNGPLAVKLMRHQQAEPPDLKELRPDVPDALLPIIRRMLAKKAGDRYQTPGEVAAALAGLKHPPRRRISRRVLAVAGCAMLMLAAAFLLARPSSPSAGPGVKTIAETKPLPPPPPGSVAATVPEARDYQLVYDLNLGRLAKEIVYDEDNHAKITQPFDRIAYFIELRRNDGEPQWLYVSMAAFTTEIKKIGVPTLASGASFQCNVASMNVYSNVSGIVAGTGIVGGNIEFWPNNYGPHNAKNVPNADSGKYDFGDQMTAPLDGYGSMQVHNHDAKQTLFAVNHWPAGTRADLGIGNNLNGHPDWTFTGNAGSYKTKRLRVLVHCK